MRVVQIGAGHWGSSWGPVVQAEPGIELVAVVDTRADAAYELARGLGLGRSQCFTTLDVALRAHEADAALVFTPPEAHAAIAVPALGAGLHCLVEKPLAHTMASAAAIVAAADTARRVAVVSQNYRCRAVPRTAARLLRDGAIGQVGFARVDFRAAPDFTGFLTEIPEPFIARWMIHQLDLLRAVLGVDPTWLRARSWNPSWSRFAGHASCLVELGTADLEIVYTGSWASRAAPTSDHGDWSVEGSNGVLTISGDTITLERGRGPETVAPDPLQPDDRAGVLRGFVETVAGRASSDTRAADNLHTLALLLAALESVRRDTRVDVLAAAAHGELLAASPSNPDAWRGG